MKVSPIGYLHQEERSQEMRGEGTGGNEDYYPYIRRSFSRLAPFYNVIAMPLFAVRNGVVRMADIGKGSTVLDVCTGTGSQAFAFGKRHCEVIGIDLSEEMLKIARYRNRCGNVTFEIADGTRMPFRDCCFDISCVSFGLHDMPQDARRQTLGEMRRVSKRAVIVDYNIPKNRLHRWFHINAIALYESKYFKDFASRDLSELLQQCDLKVVKEAHGLVDVARILVCEAA